MESKCTKRGCILCTMNEPNQSMRRAVLVKCFNDLHLADDPEELITTVTGIWNIALTQPNDGEFPSLGVFDCMAKLIDRGVNDPKWLSIGKNLYVPYYAAHIIGSYTMNRAEFSETAVKSGVIPPLMELLRGRMSWVEQRVAVRALGHLASHKRSFKYISAAAAAYEEEIVKLAMEIASASFNTDQYKGENNSRPEYHRDLMTRGRGGPEMEEKKAEEWAGQLQCWSLYLLTCFAIRKRCINLICKNKEFLRNLCSMWGGIENQGSFSGVALIRSLCLTQTGRRSIASLNQLVLNLCNLCRSSDEWQWKAIESILILLKEKETRYRVMDIAIPFLVDLVELKISTKKTGRIIAAGDMVTQILLQDYGRIKYGQMVLENKRSENILEEIWNLKVERRKRDDMMSEQEFRETKVLVGKLKREGNHRFWSGNTEEAIEKYTRALNTCPLKMKKERTVLYSNRAQCHLILKNAESAISDTTRALCLSGPTNPHIKSLWRRSQAYDMMGEARQSLTDCLMFVNQRSKLRTTKEKVRIPYYAVRMLNKQINATHPFAKAVSVSGNASGRGISSTVGHHESRCHEGASTSRSRSRSIGEYDGKKTKKMMTRKINNFFNRNVV